MTYTPSCWMQGWTVIMLLVALAAVMAAPNPAADTIVIGLGSGRSGTKSLAGLLDQQPGAHVTHEARGCSGIPWEVVDEQERRHAAQTRLDQLLQEDARCGADKCAMGGDMGRSWDSMAYFPWLSEGRPDDGELLHIAGNRAARSREMGKCFPDLKADLPPATNVTQ